MQNGAAAAVAADPMSIDKRAALNSSTAALTGLNAQFDAAAASGKYDTKNYSKMKMLLALGLMQPPPPGDSGSSDSKKAQGDKRAGLDETAGASAPTASSTGSTSKSSANTVAEPVPVLGQPSQTASFSPQTEQLAALPPAGSKLGDLNATVKVVGQQATYNALANTPQTPNQVSVDDKTSKTTPLSALTQNNGKGENANGGQGSQSSNLSNLERAALLVGVAKHLERFAKAPPSDDPETRQLQEAVKEAQTSPEKFNALIDEVSQMVVDKGNYGVAGHQFDRDAKGDDPFERLRRNAAERRVASSAKLPQDAAVDSKANVEIDVKNEASVASTGLGFSRSTLVAVIGTSLASLLVLFGMRRKQG